MKWPVEEGEAFACHVILPFFSRKARVELGRVLVEQGRMYEALHEFDGGLAFDSNHSWCISTGLGSCWRSTVPQRPNPKRVVHRSWIRVISARAMKLGWARSRKAT